MTSAANTIDYLGNDPIEMAARLEALATDLRQLQAGHLPGPEIIAGAPLIRGWGIGSRAFLVLSGTAHGHPCVPEAHRRQTSPLMAIDRANGWARTLSRYYALGPAGLFGGIE